MQDFIDDHVRTRMETVPGVSLVNVYGGAERQVQVLLDPSFLGWLEPPLAFLLEG